jgi:hypothetical protein
VNVLRFGDIMECALCSHSGTDVRPGLACYAEDGRFERVDRCIDHQACRERVESDGEEWPLIDITDKVRIIR